MKLLCRAGLGIALLILEGCTAQEYADAPILPVPAARRPEVRARMTLQGAPALPARSGAAIKQRLGLVIDAALRGNLDGVLASLSTEDRLRIAGFSQEDRKALRQIAESFNADWSSRYGEPFAWDSEALQREVFLKYQLSEGQDAAHAFVVIPAGRGMGRITLALHDEGGQQWRINVPAAMNAPVLQDRLNGALEELDAQKMAWPAEVSDAAGLAAQKILEAFAIE